MKTNSLFQDKVTLRIWDHFFHQTERTLKPLAEAQKEELTLELQDHLYTSFQQEKEGGEAERLMAAIERLGDPEAFLKPLLADKLLAQAARSLNPKTVIKGLYFFIAGGIRNLLLALFYICGYAVALTFFFMAVLKPLIPDHAGILWFNDGSFVAGVSLNSSGVAHDPLGYLIIPIGLAISILAYIGTTKLLHILKSRKKPGLKK